MRWRAHDAAAATAEQARAEADAAKAAALAAQTEFKGTQRSCAMCSSIGCSDDGITTEAAARLCCSRKTLNAHRHTFRTC